MSSASSSSAADERDNPTYKNFKTQTPVKKTRTPNPSERALNREGRAICRIASTHQISVSQIARIFRVSYSSVQRAIDNAYSPRDVVAEDYAHLKDPEFSKHFPPDAAAPTFALKQERHGRKRSESPQTTSDEDDSDVPLSLKRKCRAPPPKSVSAAFTAKKPRHFSSFTPSKRNSDSESHSQPPCTSTSTAQLPRRKPRSPAETKPLFPTSSPTTLSAFLKNVNKIDLSAYRSLLSARGFTLERIRIMGETWTDKMVKEAVERGLCEDEEEDERKTLNAIDALTLELEIRKLRGKTGSSPTPIANSGAIPPSLSAFLRNVVGFDLTEHRALFAVQGLDIDRLCVMREWDAEDLREVVGRALQPREEGAGWMSKLEILAVEFALRDG
ncbi:hypothetical protein FB45DRAFT_1064449 [Roridomyces roridus]|uniref:Uncharacterized protein n=1 Tax=Roridomyces roridus TaxID=1738132 RepID=A0AAD7BAJ3_9AGAR|nr:hypothetical protein FB45DRAFT_1064449 [Roridomyces roridus]